MGPERCLLCGEPIPEGTQVCPVCMEKYKTLNGSATADCR